MRVRWYKANWEPSALLLALVFTIGCSGGDGDTAQQAACVATLSGAMSGSFACAALVTAPLATIPIMFRVAAQDAAFSMNVGDWSEFPPPGKYSSETSTGVPSDAYGSLQHAGQLWTVQLDTKSSTHIGSFELNLDSLTPHRMSDDLQFHGTLDATLTNQYPDFADKPILVHAVAK